METDIHVYVKAPTWLSGSEHAAWILGALARLNETDPMVNEIVVNLRLARDETL